MLPGVSGATARATRAIIMNSLGSIEAYVDATCQIALQQAIHGGYIDGAGIQPLVAKINGTVITSMGAECRQIEKMRQGASL